MVNNKIDEIFERGCCNNRYVTDKKSRKYFGTKEFKEKAITLRKSGFTFQEINRKLRKSIPKSTLATWCEGIKTPKSYQHKLKTLNLKHLF